MSTLREMPLQFLTVRCLLVTLLMTTDVLSCRAHRVREVGGARGAQQTISTRHPKASGVDRSFLQVAPSASGPEHRLQSTYGGTARRVLIARRNPSWMCLEMTRTSILNCTAGLKTRTASKDWRMCVLVVMEDTPWAILGDITTTTIITGADLIPILLALRNRIGPYHRLRGRSVRVQILTKVEVQPYFHGVGVTASFGLGRDALRKRQSPSDLSFCILRFGLERLI